MSEDKNQEPSMEEILASIRKIISDDGTPADDVAGDAAIEPPVSDEMSDDMEDDDILELDDIVEVNSTVDDVFDVQPEPIVEEIADVADTVDFDQVVMDDDFTSIDEMDSVAMDQPLVAPEPKPEPKPQQTQQQTQQPVAIDQDELLSPGIESVAAGAFSQLTQVVQQSLIGQNTTRLGDPSRTLEDLVRELMRPLLKDWLDQNLPGIVEQMVQAEIERIVQRATRK